MSFDNEEEENALASAANELSVLFTNSTNTSETFFYDLTRTPSAATDVYSYGWSNGSPLLYIPFDSADALRGENLCGTLVFKYSNRSATIHFQADPCLSQRAYLCKKPRGILIKACSF